MVLETEMHNSQEELQGNHLRKQLAACVRSIQWSYAIFWSMSTRQEGLLEWNDGYYNGDIKTRKTTQPTECKADQMVLYRSEQLRELYESLSADSIQQNRRPSASLSPEDLTDAEWYYLICMSFTFMLGQDLPGKVYKHNEPIWLNNAQLADNKSFGRSLLAKSASIQTVVCFPFMDGVLELGTSDLVLDDPGFVQNITSSFWELQTPICSEHSTSSPPLVGKEENMCTVLGQEVEDAMMLENHALMIENDSHAFSFAINSYAPNKETDLIHDNVIEHPTGLYDEIIATPEVISNVCDDPSGIKRLKESSQVHRGHLIDDEFSNSLHNSLNSRECLSWSFAQNILSSPKGERVKSNMLDYLQEDNHAKPSSLAVESDGSHYDSTLSAVLRNLKQQISPAVFSVQNGSNASSFKVWRSGSRTTKIFTKIPQRMLKKILIDNNWVNGDRLVKPQEEHVSRNKAWKSETDDTNANHVLSERRRREKLNEKFLILRSLVPSISKVDKASILADTIEYLKELERRVEELESCREEADPDMRESRKHPDIAERTCDNYGNNGLINCQKSSTNKRKASELDEAEAEHHRLSSRNGAMDMNITIIEKEVLVEMQCPWRDFLLLDIIEAMSNLRLDAHSVQSSTVDSTLAITLRAKLIGTVVASPGMIKRALQRVVRKY